MLLASLGIVLALLPSAAFAQGQIMLVGQILRKCSIVVAADPNASNVPLTAAGAQRLLVGTATQDCNGRNGYTLYILSADCLAAPTGAKLTDAVSADYLSYSVESDNPTTGGSQPVVTGLLASACTNQVMRDVTSAIIHSQVSTLYINYTGSSSLSAGTYQDILTVTMTMK